MHFSAPGNDANGGIESRHAVLECRAIDFERAVPHLATRPDRVLPESPSQSARAILAWGEVDKGLAELQAAYRAEADVPFLLVGLRGERAAFTGPSMALSPGSLTFSDLEIHGLQKANPAQDAASTFTRDLLPGDHAKAVEML